MEAVVALRTGWPGAPLGPSGPCGPCISDFISTVPDDRTSLFSLLGCFYGAELSLLSGAACRLDASVLEFDKLIVPMFSKWPKEESQRATVTFCT